MRRTKKLTKGLNEKLFIDAIIAVLIIQQAPKLLNEYIFKTSPLTGMSLELGAAVVAYVVGMITKKPNIGTIGIALAAGDLLNSTVSGLIPSSTTSVQALQDYGNLQLIKDYNSNIGVMPSKEFSEAY